LGVFVCSASSERGKKKPPQTPAALNAHQGWSIVDSNDFEPLSFDFQESYLDELLTTRAISYIQHFRQRFNDKLKVNLLEPTELNVFQLLTSSALESVCEYSNESLNLNGRTPMSPSEFRRFIGTLLLTGAFNLSMDHTFSIMETITGGSNVKIDRFREILHNFLRGYECSSRSNTASTQTWDDQRNLLHNLHPLEQKMFERSIHYFFDRDYGCYVFDDELLASKAVDVELRTLSDRKAGGEGPTVDCLCDAFLQVVLGMHLRTTTDTQQGNLEKLMDRFPQVEPNSHSELDPILVMDRGFGKLKLVLALGAKNFKILTIAAALGSEHPIVPSSAQESYLEKLRKHYKDNKNDSSDEEQDQLFPVVNAEDQFIKSLLPWTISDNSNVLLGPEVMLASNIENSSLVAVAIRDIFDKKVHKK
jgi:hypothetical protein